MLPKKSAQKILARTQKILGFGGWVWVYIPRPKPKKAQNNLGFLEF